MSDFQLTQADKATGVWLRLKAHFEDRLAGARQRNDSALDAHETAAIRGEIRCLKHLIRLDDDRPMTGNDEDAP